MSDCSTKTCGNCAMYDADNTQCDYFIIVDGLWGHERHSPEDKACEDWVEWELTLEERWPQLVQLARDMYEWAEGVTSRHYTVVPGRVDSFRARLEALGVSLDG